MLIPFVITALFLSFEDIRELRKKNEKKDVLVYAIFMLAVILLCIWYSAQSLNRSITDMLMGLFNIQG